MDTPQIHAAATGAGVVAAAMDEVTARVRDHFGEDQPKPADVATFISALPVWTKLGMPEATFLAMPPEWRMTEARRLTPPAVRQRPYRPPAPADMLRQWEGLPLTERMAKYRAWCDEQPRP